MNLKTLTLILLTGSIMLSCNNSTRDKRIFNSLTQELNEIYSRGQIDGFSVAIVNEQEILYEQGFGYSDLNCKSKYDEKSVENVNSISRLVITLGILKAQELDLLNTDDPIDKYLPFNLLNLNSPEKKVTINQLLVQSYSDPLSHIFIKDKYMIQHKTPEHNIDSKYINHTYTKIKLFHHMNQLLSKLEYKNPSAIDLDCIQNLNITLCALILESISKQAFNAFVQDHILQPLGMEKSDWFLNTSNTDSIYTPTYKISDTQDLLYINKHFTTSTHDIAKLLSELINGQLGKSQLLNKKLYTKLFTLLLNKSPFNNNRNHNIGLFIEKINTMHVIGYSGNASNVYTLILFDAKRKIGRILMKNTSHESMNAHTSFWTIWNTLDKYQNKYNRKSIRYRRYFKFNFRKHRSYLSINTK